MHKKIKGIMLAGIAFVALSMGITGVHASPIEDANREINETVVKRVKIKDTSYDVEVKSEFSNEFMGDGALVDFSIKLKRSSGDKQAPLYKYDGKDDSGAGIVNIFHIDFELSDDKASILPVTSYPGEVSSKVVTQNKDKILNQVPNFISLSSDETKDMPIKEDGIAIDRFYSVFKVEDNSDFLSEEKIKGALAEDFFEEIEIKGLTARAFDRKGRLYLPKFRIVTAEGVSDFIEIGGNSTEHKGYKYIMEAKEVNRGGETKFNVIRKDLESGKTKRLKEEDGPIYVRQLVEDDRYTSGYRPVTHNLELSTSEVDEKGNLVFTFEHNIESDGDKVFLTASDSILDGRLENELTMVDFAEKEVDKKDDEDKDKDKVKDKNKDKDKKEDKKKEDEKKDTDEKAKGTTVNTAAAAADFFVYFTSSASAAIAMLIRRKRQ